MDRCRPLSDTPSVIEAQSMTRTYQLVTADQIVNAASGQSQSHRPLDVNTA